MKPFFGVAVVTALLVLTGCTGGGPRADDILGAENAVKVGEPEEKPFVLVELGQSNAEIVSRSIVQPPSSLPRASEQPFIIGRGDVLSVAIVSNNETGFIDFTQSAITPLSTVELPLLEVSNEGTVGIPTLGRVQASGLSVADFENKLTEQLSEILVNPRALVRLAERNSARASVIGDGISQPGSYAIGQTKNHLLDVIGQAGGPTRGAEDLIVSLSRRGVTSQARLQDVYANASLNVHVLDRDVISLEPNLTRVQVLGGTTENSQLTFETVNVNLMDVISKAGGLINTRASLRGVFIYRNAPPNQLFAIGATLESFDQSRPIPTVFRLDMREPTSIFAGAAFEMMDGDIVYVADNLNEDINIFFGTTSNIIPTPAEYILD